MSVNSKTKNINEKKLGKKIFRGPSEDTFLTFSHSLNAFADQIYYFLTAKGFKLALTRRKKNDPIEHLFSVTMCLGSHHLALYVSEFSCNERTSILCVISQSFSNQDGSHNKILRKSFFKEGQSMLQTS